MKKIFFIIFLFGIFLAKQASASDFFLVNSPADINNQDEFLVDLLIDAGSARVNAVSGKIIVPADFFMVKEIIDGSSDINFWVEKPFTDGQNSIRFSGIVPGGFTGQAKILSVILTAKKTGPAVISVADAEALLNDGLGTADTAAARELKLNIKPKIANQTPLTVSLTDAEPPEAFTPEITRIPSLFGNAYALVFVAQDKLSGIGQYKILENKTYNFFGLKFETGAWQEAASPYRLKDQELHSDIYVKAIDKAGNERTAYLPAALPAYWYENYLIWGIIILAAIISLIIFCIYVRKHK